MSRFFYEFGPFRLDPVKRRLLREDSPVPLTPKAFDTLLALVEHGGQVVEKDSLMKAVWGDTIVEEVGLARNISALRKALGEQPDTHRYIVTVPGRGYSFVEDVRAVPVDGGAPSEVLVAHTLSRVIAEEEEVTEEAVSPGRGWVEEDLQPAPAALAPAATRPRRLTLRAALALGAISALVALGAFLYLRPRPVVIDRDSILIADFVNSTGDPSFDRVLQLGLEAQLEQSPQLNIFPGARVRETLRMMGRSLDEPITLPLAREVSLRHGVKVALAGDIAALGQNYVLTLQAVNAQTGETLARAQTEVTRKEEVLRGLSEAVRGLRERLGESLSSIQQFYTPLEEATTTSLEALQAYSLGRERILQDDDLGALGYYQRAVEIDPGFAIAWNALADLQYSIDPPAAIASIERAYALRDRTSELEQIRITLTWSEITHRDLELLVREGELFRSRYPYSWRPYWSLGTNLLSLGQNERALPHARELVRLNPAVPDHHFLLAEILARLDRRDEALATCRQAGVAPGLFSVCGFLTERPGHGRVGEAASSAADLFWQAVRATSQGRWQRAQELAARVRRIPARTRETDARLSRQLQVAAALVGDCRLQWPLEETAPLWLLADSSVARALCGNVAAATRFIERHVPLYPRDTLLHGLYLPSVRAAQALAERQPAEAIALLQGTEPFAGIRDYWPTWLRGEAYLQQGDGVAAAGEFRRILASSGMYLDSPLLPLAHLGLARAAARAGDLAQSRASYEEFFEVWTSADSDLPVLVRARREYADLTAAVRSR